MQVLNRKTLKDSVIEYLSLFNNNLTLSQEEELSNIINEYLEKVEENLFRCGYCDITRPRSQGIWEDLNNGISFFICESCYMAGIDTV